ncbi:MAG: glycosyltransferase family 9 protein [Ktedonobacterales bacterium]
MPAPRRIPEAEPAPVALGAHPRILAIKLATLGDLLLTTPALRALRTRYPRARLDVLTTAAAAPLLTDSPLVDAVYTLDLPPGARAPMMRGAGALLTTLTTLRAARYDAALLLHHLTLPAGRRKHRTLLTTLAPRLTAGLDNGFGGFLDLRVPDHGFGARHEAEYALAIARAVDATLPAGERGLRVADLGWEALATEPPETEATGSPPLVALHPGSGSYSRARRWPVARFAEVAAALRERYGVRVVVIAGPGDEAALAAELLATLGQPPWAEIAAPTTPRALAAVLARCALFIGNDSFPMHLATALGRPVVAVFGPSNAQAWGPYAPDCSARVALVRRDDLACSPCFYHGHDLGLREGCPPRPCLTALPAARVLAAARRLLPAQAAPAAPPAG